uniref:Uncharacterized protein n=1 Tax=Arundo donax TaxID=35708 RepID=A0A0A9TTB9_ARUDO
MICNSSKLLSPALPSSLSMATALSGSPSRTTQSSSSSSWPPTGLAFFCSTGGEANSLIITRSLGLAAFCSTGGEDNSLIIMRSSICSLISSSSTS